MSSSPAFKWILGLLLVLSLGSKWAVSAYAPAVQTEQEEKAEEDSVIKFLAQNHFNIVGARKVTFGMYLVEATAGLCQLRVVLSASRGWHRDLIQSMEKSEERTFVVFRGKIYSDQPMLLTVADFLRYKLLTKLGIGAHAHPVMTVMSAPICGAEGLAWNEMR